MPAPDIAIPIAFPDYLIAVNTPAVTVGPPKWVPGNLPSVTIPATKNRLEDLGHAGILFINGLTGLTKYYEYGRYRPSDLDVIHRKPLPDVAGLVRRRPVPDVRIVNGRPTAASLRTTLQAVAAKAGQGGRISAAYIELPAGGFAKMLEYARAREVDNADADREPYKLLSNSCLHFSRSVAIAGGADMPWVLKPWPGAYIERVRADFPPLELINGVVRIEGIALP